MKTIFIVLFCLCVATFASAADGCQYLWDDINIADDGKFLYEGKPVTGVMCSYDSNKILELKGSLKNGLEDGVLTAYYPNGKTRQETPYKNGVREGLTKAYYTNGQVSQETPHKNGVREGVTKYYEEDGVLSQEETHKNNLLEGTMKVYDEDGKLFIQILYKSDESVSGACANGRALTSKELEGWDSGYDIYCDVESDDAPPPWKLKE